MGPLLNQNPDDVIDILCRIQEVKTHCVFWCKDVLHIFGNTGYTEFACIRRMVYDLGELLVAEDYRIISVTADSFTGSYWLLQAVPNTLWRAAMGLEPHPAEWTVQRKLQFRETLVEQIDRTWEFVYEAREAEEARRSEKAEG